MPIKIGSNITSLNVQRNLGDATLQLSKSMERLSSGLRINRASDDAAGLSISETLKSSSRVYTTALRNVNDGISFLSIADSAMAELANITTRNLELSEQSANGSYSKVQRQALDAEADELVNEFNRIVKTTEFNGLKVLDVEESSGLVRIQAGYGIDGSLGLSLGQEFSRYVGTGVFGSSTQYSAESTSSSAIQFGDIDGDGDLDMVTAGMGGSAGFATVRKNNGDGTFGTAVQYSTDNMGSYGLQLADIDGDGDLDMITCGTMVAMPIFSIRKNNGDGTFGALTIRNISGLMTGTAMNIMDIDGDGSLDIAVSGKTTTCGTVALLKNNGNGTFGTAVLYSTEATLSNSIQFADIDGDGDLDMISAGNGGGSGKASTRMNNGDGTFGALTTYSTENTTSYAVQLGDIDGDGDLDLITAGNNGGTGKVTIRLNKGDGTFDSATQYTTEYTASYALQLADIDGDGNLDLITAGGESGKGRATIRKNNGDGTFGPTLKYITESNQSNALQIVDVNGDGILDLATSGKTMTQGFCNIRFGIGHDVTTVEALNLCTQSNARSSLTLLRDQLDRISAERGNIGSAQSRLSVALNTIATTRENFDAATSRITDVDVSQEAADMTRSEIVQQVGASILASANQAPEIALKLLK